jgi:AcrR family transcriptional regulator
MSDFNQKQIEILQVAEQLFAEKGFDGTSIREISKIAKINIAMVSYYFGSKEKLLESLILFRTSDLKLKLENLYDEKVSPLQKIEKFIAFYIEKVNSNKNMYQILNFENSTKKRVLDSAVFTAIKKGNLQTLKNIIKEGQDALVFKKNVNVELITPTILGTYFYFNMNKPFFGEIFNLESENDFNDYVKFHLTKHIQQTVKALLIYEN